VPGIADTAVRKRISAFSNVPSCRSVRSISYSWSQGRSRKEVGEGNALKYGGLSWPGCQGTLARDFGWSVQRWLSRELMCNRGNMAKRVKGATLSQGNLKGGCGQPCHWPTQLCTDPAHWATYFDLTALGFGIQDKEHKAKNINN
jgi:hypothetical protein